MAFATAGDIAARMGRELASSEAAPVALLLEGATAMIAAAADKDDDWAAALDPVPTVLWLICIELTTRALGNPQNIASMQEGLGAHNVAVRFRDAGIIPTPAEELIIRRAVYGTNAGSSRANNLANHLTYCNDELLISESLVAS